MQDRAQEAGSLLGHKVFGEAIEELKKDYFIQITELPVGSPKVLEIHAKIRLLDEVVGELKSIVADYEFRRRREQ